MHVVRLVHAVARREDVAAARAASRRRGRPGPACAAGPARRRATASSAPRSIRLTRSSRTVPGAIVAGPADDQRHAQARVVDPALPRGRPRPWSPQKTTIVSSARPSFSSCVQDARRRCWSIDRDEVVVAGPVVADDRRVGVVRRQHHLRRVVPLGRRGSSSVEARDLAVASRSGSRGSVMLKTAKNGWPSARCRQCGLGAVLVPRGERRVEVVVGLDVVRAVVAGGAQVLGEAADVGGGTTSQRMVVRADRWRRTCR